MLFSNPEISAYINQNFEPAWESVRSVPTITLDFGNGQKVTRTLHGNIATYVCTADGSIIDVIPGVYEPQAYLRQLKKMSEASRNIMVQSDRQFDLISKYHKDELARNKALNKLMVEPQTSVEGHGKVELVSDTSHNEWYRRRQIHQMLLKQSGATPDSFKKALYKNVLHADLDDPHLGLDKYLSATYPFDDNS
ncbi:hypothetical protein KA183_11470 [bacterium]|nr:hypothetical protein [bacterium]